MKPVAPVTKVGFKFYRNAQVINLNVSPSFELIPMPAQSVIPLCTTPAACVRTILRGFEASAAVPAVIERGNRI